MEIVKYKMCDGINSEQVMRYTEELNLFLGTECKPKHWNETAIKNFANTANDDTKDFVFLFLDEYREVERYLSLEKSASGRGASLWSELLTRFQSVSGFKNGFIGRAIKQFEDTVQTEHDNDWLKGEAEHVLTICMLLFEKLASFWNEEN